MTADRCLLRRQGGATVGDDANRETDTVLPEHLSRWGVDLHRRRVVAAQVVTAALLPAVSWAGWPAAAAAAVLVLLVATVDHRGASAAVWLARSIGCCGIANGRWPGQAARRYRSRSMWTWLGSARSGYAGTASMR